MANTILFVFEGKKAEKQIFRSIQKNFFPMPGSKAAVKSFFCGDMLQLWKKVKDDEDLDIVEILREIPESDIGDLKRGDVSETHLFFDHDAHACSGRMSQEEYHKVTIGMLDTFNNEQERGKLWISYPMVEALKHCKKDACDYFRDIELKIYDNTEYKKLVSEQSDYIDIRKYGKCAWYHLTAVNVQRAYCLMNDTCKDEITYDEIEKEWFERNAFIVKAIHEKQYEKFIEPRGTVAVLSPFPLFLLYYRGRKFFLEDCNCGGLVKECGFRYYQ
ncbi:MAG: hypothetical protein FWE09_00590 [Treponema sp.]|nr:hypothetical protein [Treponema sp.]